MTEVKVSPAPVDDKANEESAGLVKDASASSDKKSIADYNPITMAQAKLKVNKRFKVIIANTVLFIVAVDLLGSAICFPAIPSLCAWAPGGPADTIITEAKASANYDAMTAEQKAVFDSQLDAVVEEYISPDAFKDPKPPLKYSLSMNLIMSVAQVGSAGGSLAFGSMADKIGPKTPMIICVSMGIVGYLIIYAAGKWINNYYLLALGLVWNNFFGNTMGVAVVYMKNLFEPGPEQETYAGSVLGMGLIGGSIGGLVVMPFITDPKNGANYFNAIWLALGLTVASLILSIVVVVEPPKEKPEQVAKRNSKKDEEEQKTPVFAKRILVIAIIASALDSAGDEGTRMARGTIMTNLFPEWATIERQNYLVIGLLFIVLIALALLAGMRKCFNLGAICVIGCVFTLATQLALMLEWEAVPFIVIWHVGKFFGFLSTLGSGFIIQEIAPKDLVGLWCGRNDALTNLAGAITPLIFSSVYDEVGNKRGQEMLACTSAVSLFAVVAYAPLIGMLPKPMPAAKEDELKDLEVYENMSDAEYMQLSMAIQSQVEEKMAKEGKKTRVLGWGNYHEERPSLLGLQDRVVKDFEFIRSWMIATLTDRKKMLEMQEMSKMMKDQTPPISREDAKAEMGTWIADYLDDAGYDNWETQGPIYKAMLMNAFPPVDALDDQKPDYGTMSLDQIEEHMTKFLAIMDFHLDGAKRRLQVGQSAGSITNLLNRR